jgi:2-polyprenyl-3-methyl-5-hydroxy-6-metoxy-1,4-benzoquinol methylase
MNYAHAPSEREYARLSQQSRIWAEEAESVLARTIRPGMICLDVGCGEGSIMRTMANLGGNVTGIDLDENLRSQVAPLTFLCGNLLDVDVPQRSFDVVFCRLVLMHLSDPLLALKRMREWAKPGGAVIVQEFGSGMAVSSNCPPMAEFRRLFKAVFRGTGRALGVGLKLPNLFRQAGLTMSNTNSASRFLPLAEVVDMVIDLYDAWVPTAQRLGVEHKSDAFRCEMRDAAASGHYYCLLPVLITAEGKPGRT